LDINTLQFTSIINKELIGMKSLGDVSVGRPQLGESMPVLVYRLFETAIHGALVEEYNQEQADHLFRKAGHMAGTFFAENFLNKDQPFEDFISQLQEKLSSMRMGILRIERADLADGTLQLSVYEDLDCSGLPVTDEQVCVYDEGLLAGILEYYTNVPFNVREVDCWASGERVCRFKAERS
jgi:predicted hydrocarbon binding protein